MSMLYSAIYVTSHNISDKEKPKSDLDESQRFKSKSLTISPKDKSKSLGINDHKPTTSKAIEKSLKPLKTGTTKATRDKVFKEPDDYSIENDGKQCITINESKNFKITDDPPFR